ncbi:hypothetical protein ACI784_09215 [Geodermatophilus sp. SYSU D01186]
MIRDDEGKPPLAEALSRAGDKPETLTAEGRDNRKAKKNWAQRFSNALAMTVADALRPLFPKARVTPRPDGSGQEFTVGGKIDRKRTDVGVWDDAAGLVAGVSIKTYSFRDTHGATGTRDARIGRYSRNVKRNDMELRDEADTLHRRQPYAVLVALFFLPEDACWDGVTGQSSFAHVVFTLRKRAGRESPDGRYDLFEHVFVGLVTDAGDVRFFDVRKAPPENQPPSRDDTISLAELIALIDDAVVFRNTGVSRHERYAEPDPDWQPPAGSLPAGLEQEAPLTLDLVATLVEIDRVLGGPRGDADQDED